MGFSDEAAFLAVIGGTKSGITRALGPYVDPAAAELVSNGGFGAGTTGWAGYANGTAAATISEAGGELVVDGQGGSSNGFSQLVAGLVVNRAYRVMGTTRRGTTTSYSMELRMAGNAALNGTSSFTALNATTSPVTVSAAGSAEIASMYVGGRLNGGVNNGTSIFDDVSLKEALPFANFVPGSISALIEATTPATASGNKVVFQADGGSTERNRIRLVYDGTGHLRLIATFANIEIANLDLGAVAASTPFRVALSAANNSYSAALDGQPAVTDLSGTFPGIGMIRIGRSSTGETWDGSIERVRLF